jgi:hypothetical protein
LLVAVILAIAAILALPTEAADTAKGTCSAKVGTNTITYDCNYVAKGYEVGTVLPLQMGYSCSVRCGGVLSFGLSGPGYAPKGEVEGHIVSVDRGPGSLKFAMQFSKLHDDAAGNGNSDGSAFMTVMLNVDDGSGRFQPTSLPFKVQVNSPGGSAGSN